MPAFVDHHRKPLPSSFATLATPATSARPIPCPRALGGDGEVVEVEAALAELGGEGGVEEGVADDLAGALGDEEAELGVVAEGLAADQVGGEEAGGLALVGVELVGEAGDGFGVGGGGGADGDGRLVSPPGSTGGLPAAPSLA